jgi:hypothetical protein
VVGEQGGRVASIRQRSEGFQGLSLCLAGGKSGSKDKSDRAVGTVRPAYLVAGRIEIGEVPSSKGSGNHTVGVRPAELRSAILVIWQWSWPVSPSPYS